MNISDIFWNLKPGLIASSAIDNLVSRKRVASGPFAGAPAIEPALQHEWNKLLGIYEFYLHEAIEEVIRKQPPVVIGVGASSGYYAVGLAYVLPDAKHIAFEMDESLRILLKQSLSKVRTEVSIEGLCTSSQLLKYLAENNSGFLVMDCEGGEKELLSDEIRNHALHWTILLEVHNYHAPGVGEEIRKRFEFTHEIREIWSRKLLAKEFQFLFKWPLNFYCEKTLQMMCEEGRGGAMQFFYMIPRHTPAAE